jgi:TonB family protein
MAAAAVIGIILRAFDRGLTNWLSRSAPPVEAQSRETANLPTLWSVVLGARLPPHLRNDAVSKRVLTDSEYYSPDSVYFDFQVEKRASVSRSGSPPRYPLVHFLGLRGSVIVEFIVDTTGLVLSRSIRIVQSSNARLNQPVLQAVRSMLFAPAELYGHRVKELVEMPFAFPPSRGD